VKLYFPIKKGDVLLEECLEKRISRRRFTAKELTREQISQLLWAGLGFVSVLVGIFHDEQVHENLSPPQNEKPLYISPVGYAAE